MSDQFNCPNCGAIFIKVKFNGRIHLMKVQEFAIPGYGKTLMVQIDPEVADLRQVSDILRGAKQNE